MIIFSVLPKSRASYAVSVMTHMPVVANGLIVMAVLVLVIGARHEVAGFYKTLKRRRSRNRVARRSPDEVQRLGERFLALANAQKANSVIYALKEIVRLGGRVAPLVRGSPQRGTRSRLAVRGVPTR